MKRLPHCSHCGGSAHTYPVPPSSFDDYEAMTVCTWCGASMPGYGKTQKEANDEAESKWAMRFDDKEN